MPATVSRGRGRRTINEINMVPFIDVMLVLLIIFMVTAPLIAPSMVNLPSVGKGSTPPKNVIEIVIHKDETLEFRQGNKASPIAVAQVAEAAVKAQKGFATGESAVVISADRSVKYETVVKVMDTLQRAGVQRVGLSVKNAGN
jgi:biopolymer transport protein TolR